MCRMLLARTLDRLNVAVVRRRLRRDRDFAHPRTAGAGSAGEATPTGVPGLRAAGRVQIWGAEGSDWVASRVPCRQQGRDDRAVILLHGWLAAGLQLAYYRRLAAPLTRRCDLWMPRLPAHAERTPRGAVSGSRCLTPDATRTAESIRAAVAETRWLARWLQARGKAVDLWGISLGGWVAALAAREPVCERLVLWEPVVDPLETLSWSPLGRLIANRTQPEEEIASPATTLAELSPSSGELALHGDRVLIVGGVHDNVVRHDTLVAASERWGARIESLPHGHISLLLSIRSRRTTLEWLAERADAAGTNF